MAHKFEKKWRSQDVQLQENVDFSAMLLSDRVLAGLAKAGFKKPSPIQLEAIPVGRFGKDLFVQAKSGTGKTLVFVTVALEMLKRKLFCPQVLILAPTREIATQICSVVKAVGVTFPKLTCNSFIGGLSFSEDTKKVYTTQIVVGTPGRIKQLIETKALPTTSIRLLVFDEADKLLDRTFKETIQDIFSYLPDGKQVIATSATYPQRMVQMVMHFLKEPQVVNLNPQKLALLGIVHYAKMVKYCPLPLLLYRNKLNALEGILKKVKFSQCLLFCNGIQKVEVLYRDVKKWGFSAAYISSAKEQPERQKAIDKLKNFKCKVLVSSDVTARGIDAENVDLVINFDLTYGTETYLHRVGRAGRYGSIGVAVTIIDENEVRYLESKEKEGSFKVYKLPDPIPRNLIQEPVLGEYFIEVHEECESVCSEKSNFSDNADGVQIDYENGECNSSKSPETVHKSIHVSTEQTSTEGMPVSEDDIPLLNDVAENSSLNDDSIQQMSLQKMPASEDITLLNDENSILNDDSVEQMSTEKMPVPEDNKTLLEDVTENFSLNGYTVPKKDLKTALSKTEDKAAHIGDKTANVELFEASSDSVIRVVDLDENKELCKGKSIELLDVIKEADVQRSSKLTEDTKPGDILKKVQVENPNKSTDAVKNQESAFETIKNFNNIIRSYIDIYNANGNDEFAVLKDPKVEQNPVENEADRDEESAVSKDGEFKFVTENRLKALQSMKGDYLHKVFKEYLDDKSESQGTCSNVNEQIEVPSVLLQDETFPQSNSASEFANNEQNAPEGEHCIEDSFAESAQKFTEKPNYEDIPQFVGQQKCKEAAPSFNSALREGPNWYMIDPNELEELSDSFDMDDAELSGGSDEIVQISFDDSESDSCSEISSDSHSSRSSSSRSGISESGSSSSSSSPSSTSCSSESSTNSDTEYVCSKKQKEFLASRHSKRPIKCHWQPSQRQPSNFRRPHNCHCQHSQRPPSNFRRPHHCPSEQGYYQESQIYSEIPNNREYGIYVNTVCHKTRNPQRPVRCDCQHSQRPSNDFRSHNYYPAGGYYEESQIYSEIPNDREYQRYVNSNHCKTKNHQRQVRFSEGHACSDSCFRLSQHKYDPHHSCKYGQPCFQFHQIFYRQWLHLQNVVYGRRNVLTY